MKLLKTIRLDASDTFVFERAAEPGEWAVPGTFVFSDTDPAILQGKARTAFRAGFLGVSSLGWSTLVQIVEADEPARAAALEQLALQLMEHYGAPDIDAARAASDEELTFAQSLCNHETGTLVALHRTADGAEIREAFRTLKARADSKAFRAFSFMDVEGEDEGPGDRVDLVNLAQGDRK
ncbi:DUF6505 family protein [Pseudorhodoplanes sp.]|uniref:DUF6505 family protein n=1 Tax=Pseudorhodoplanes sp. TaxID=1934341 RepID=UPI003D0B925B